MTSLVLTITVTFQERLSKSRRIKLDISLLLDTYQQQAFESWLRESVTNF